MRTVSIKTLALVSLLLVLLFSIVTAARQRAAVKPAQESTRIALGLFKGREDSLSTATVEQADGKANDKDNTNDAGNTSDDQVKVILAQV